MGAQQRSDRGAGYRPRSADALLQRMLRASGAVVIEGARGSGKTATARQAAGSEVLLDTDEQARAAGLIAPELLLGGARPRLIDEWQLVPAVWNQVRRAVDDAGGEAGQYILTGSAVPRDDLTRHSGAGRFSRLRMRPMTLTETGRSTTEVSLRDVLGGGTPQARDSGMTISDIADLVSIGGWPSLQERSVEDAQIVLRGYLEETRRVDLIRVDGVARDPENVARVLRSLARNVATAASAWSIAADVAGREGPLDHHTVLTYLDALTRLFVVEDLPAWSPSLRSRTALRGAPTRHFVDPSLAVAALQTSPERLLLDVKTLGFLFESLVIRDLRVYAQAIDGRVLHYRDSSDLEADAIVELPDGRWAAFEVKLGPGAIDAAAATLLRIAERVDRTRHGEAAALAVITGWGYGYRRPDGVAVIPIGALGP